MNRENIGVIMGCIWSKGIYVLKELYKLGQLLLRRYDGVIVYSDTLFLNNRRLSQDQATSILLTALRVSEFQEKHVSERKEILKYIYRNWHYLQYDSSVIETLKETKFVTSRDGQLYKPKDLFDPSNDLFICLFCDEDQKFPAQRFCSVQWKTILRKTGLQDTSYADTVLECATRIEFRGKQAGLVGDNNTTSNRVLSFHVWCLTDLLSQAIFYNFDKLYSHNFCNKLGKIACIYAKQVVLIDETRWFKAVLCSYSEAILMKDFALAWSAAPILLIRENLIPPEYSWEALQLKSPPPFSLVLKHLQAESSSRTTEDTLKAFQYLDNIWGTLYSSDLLNLQEITLIPVGNQIYLNFYIFSHLPINLFPLAFELPSCYQPFMRILKEIGVRETLSVSSAMSILSDFYISIGSYQRLSPDEVRAVMELLQFVYNEIIQNKNSDGSDWQSLLVVPDDSRRLVLPNLCVYIDAYGSRYMKHIDSSKLRFVHRDVSERMCVAFGITKLSNAVVEELDCMQHLQTLEKIASVSLSAIKKKLLSYSFQVAVSTVFNTVSSSAENPNIQKLQTSLESIAQRLQFVECIYTRFWLLPMFLEVTHVSSDSIISEWESECKHRALYYIDRSDSCMLIAKPPEYVSVVDVVAIVVSHALGSPVTLPIASLFLCPQDSETAVVNHLKLSYDERVMDGFGFLGTDILPQDAMKVKLNPLRPFYKGEIVAWKCKNGEKLKYGRIPEDATPPRGQLLYKINIETSRGKTEAVISSHVFWFKNSTHEMSEKGNNVVIVAHVEESRGVNFGNQGRSIKESLSAVEFIQAVEEILEGTGISIDTEKQCLLQRTLSLQEQLKASQAALVLEQEKSMVRISEAERAKEPLLCPVCLCNVIDTTVVPCGHVLCHQCSLLVLHCPFCEIQLSETIKMNRS